MIWTARQREAGEEALEDARRDAAEELLVVYACPYCLTEIDPGWNTCGDEQCDAERERELRADEDEMVAAV